MLPKIVIMGRPNTGKSTLFNRIIGKRRALTDATPYLTRDAISESIVWNNFELEFTDTAGMDLDVKTKLNRSIVEQLKRLVAEADVILFTIDGHSQLTLLDDQIANLLRKSGKKVILLVNKADDRKLLKINYDFNKFGFKENYFVSAMHGTGVADLLDRLVEIAAEKGFEKVKPKALKLKKIDYHSDEEKEAETASEGGGKKKSSAKAQDRKRGKKNADADEDDAGGYMEEEEAEELQAFEEKKKPDYAIKIALIGQPNSGKSSLLNAVLGYERTLVCEDPGTTRDIIDMEIKFEGRNLLIMDTAGVRKNTSSYDRIEHYSVGRSITALKKSDIVVIMIDIANGVTFQDKHLLGVALDEGKGVVLAFNKIDLIKKKDLKQRIDEVTDFLHSEFNDSEFVPKVYISVIEKNNIFEPIRNAIRIFEATVNSEITTSMLNSYLTEIVSLHPPVAFKGRALKIFYAAKITSTPPTFILFVNDTGLVASSYRKYLINKFRKAFIFEGYPIRVIFRRRRK